MGIDRVALFPEVFRILTAYDQTCFNQMPITYIPGLGWMSEKDIKWIPICGLLGCFKARLLPGTARWTLYSNHSALRIHVKSTGIL